MGTLLLDWLQFVLRWAHLIIGIGWIGASFHFVWLDISLRRREAMDPALQGESWMVHGGGFYHVQKYRVAPEDLPETLHWFRYEAYFTWVTGFLLLACIYYAGAQTFLIDPAKADLTVPDAIVISVASLAVGWLAYDLLCKSPIGGNTPLLAALVFAMSVLAAWFYGEVFTGRAAYIHAGAFLGTIMSANVFLIIIPNQRRAVAAMMRGEAPDPALGKQAKQRSLHNNYLTLPVLAMMLSNHYPMTYGSPYAWIVAAGIFVAGGLVRHLLNLHDQGRPWRAIVWLIPAAAVVLGATIWLTTVRPAVPAVAEGTPVMTDDEAFALVTKHCSACHAARPTHEGFQAPPAGLVFSSVAAIRAAGPRIMAQAVLTQTMPLGNETGMTMDERAALGAWLTAD